MGLLADLVNSMPRTVFKFSQLSVGLLSIKPNTMEIIVILLLYVCFVTMLILLN